MFKINATFRSCISKTNIILKKHTFIENAKDPDLVMPMYNLLEYSHINENASYGKSFQYKTIIIG